MNNVLLVWELCPEESKIFYIPNVSDEDFGLLVKCHGHIGNTDNSEVDSIISEWLCEWLTDKGEYLVSYLGEDVNPKPWKSDDDFTVIHVGFAL